jgi:ParB-like chromosome segregation protein Spo0J
VSAERQVAEDTEEPTNVYPMARAGRWAADPPEHTPEPTPAPGIHRVPISALRPADSPRHVPEDTDHARLLAQSGADLPPIVVNRRTMRVIDGTHRLRAAALRDESTIEVRYFDGTDEDAFLMAVRANITHGLPLSLAEREAAAARILQSHPEWSDRAIAMVAGLAARTVGEIRRRGGDIAAGPDARIGRDGRTRPLDASRGRLAASDLIAARPEASLREIARIAGISPATARDVRERLARGDDPVPDRMHGDSRRGGTASLGARTGPKNRQAFQRSRNAVLQDLSSDPSLRFTERGRSLLRFLFAHAARLDAWRKIAELIPAHSGYTVARLARECATEWLEFAQHLEEKAEDATA